MNAIKIIYVATLTTLLSFGSVLAGTITPGGQPSFTPSNVISGNTVQVTPLTASFLVRIFGNATITPGAGASRRRAAQS